jgi:hypothetical protein
MKTELKGGCRELCKEQRHDARTSINEGGCNGEHVTRLGQKRKAQEF